MFNRKLSAFALTLSLCLAGYSGVVYAQDTPAEPAPPADSGDAQPETPADPDAPTDAAGQTDAETKAEGEEGKPSAKGKREDVALPPRPDMDADSLKELQGFQRSYELYVKEIQSYREDVDRIVESEYQRKRREIEQTYEKDIRFKELEERERREEAIAALEEFVRKHPSNPKYSPDVVYRLAELYFEKANDDYLRADESFQDEMELYELGRIADPPASPERSYDKTIALFQRLITDFPEYRYVDGAYYLLGFCLLRMGQEEDAKQAFVDLVQVTPNSRFVPEAWVRIGEFHFDYNELDKAGAAYANALNYPGNAFYDKALYKLAWTYYRDDRFDEAIKTFKQLVEYADDELERTGKTGSELREEAVQYLAISLAEEDWDGDGLPDEQFGMPRVETYLNENKGYEREVLARLGNILFDNTRYEEAVKVYRRSIERFPLDPENPKVHDRIIVSLLRMRNFDEAFAERRRLGVYYGPESEWYAHQEREGNVEALEYASGLARDNLIESATWYHEQAQTIAEQASAKSDPELEEKAKEHFRIAAKSYKDYISQYPYDRELYKWNYYLAECLFYSFQFEEASGIYADVREMDVGPNKFREPAAFNAIKAYEYLVADKIKTGALPPESLPAASLSDQAGDQASNKEETPEKRGDKPKGVPEKKPIPELVQTLNASRMRYIELGLTSADDPKLQGKLEFQAAKVYYDFNDYDEARTRFQTVIDRYPDDEVAVFAASLILESYVIAQDYEKMAVWAEKIANNPKLANSARAKEVRQEAQRLKLGAMFKKADEYMDAKAYEKAAEAYITVVNEDPKNQYADKALNNAAVAYEKVKRYESAMKLYERVTKDYPESELAPTALFRVAFNAERFFDFDKAVVSYTSLVERYPDNEKREVSMRRAGVILENVQQYDKAAATYIRFAKEFPESDDAPLALYQAGLVYEKTKDYKNMFRTFGQFRAKYGSKEEYNFQVMSSLDKVVDYHLNVTRKERDAKKAMGAVIKEYNLRGIAPGSAESQFAAKSQFYLVEYEFKKWQKIKLKGSLKKQEKLLKQKFDGANGLRPKFEQVYDYRNLEWTMAAGFRVGSIMQNFAGALYEADVPFDEGSEEYDLYKVQLEDLAIPLEDEAVSYYEKTIAKAREEKIVNEWTKKILEELNKYKPADYPLYHEEHKILSSNVDSALPPISVDDLRSWSQPAEPTEEGSTDAPDAKEETPKGGKDEGGDDGFEDEE